MARPNQNKENSKVSIRIHPSLYRLLLAYKLYLMNDGQKFAFKASMTDISKAFVDHYMDETLGSFVMRKVEKQFKEIKV